MENRKKLYPIYLASAALILFLILVSFTVSEAPVNSALSAITETRITTNSSDQMNPAIYGNRIVWQDNRNGNWISTYRIFPRKSTLAPQIRQIR